MSKGKFFVGLGLGAIFYLASVLMVIFPAAHFFSEEFGDAIYRPAQIIVGLLGKPKLTFGTACNQSGERCLLAFNYQGGFQDVDGFRFDDILSELMRAHPEVTTVCFNSPGGRNEVAAQIANLIKTKKLNTCVADILLKNGETVATSPRYTSSCQSACVFVLLAGRQRISVGDRFIIGFHSSLSTIETGKDKDRRDTDLSNDKLSNSGASYMSHSTSEAVFGQYRDLISVSESEFRIILMETSRTPASRMFYPAQESLYKLNVFNYRY